MQLDIAESDTASSRVTFTSIDSSIPMDDDVTTTDRKRTFLTSNPCGQMRAKRTAKLLLQTVAAVLYNIYLVYAIYFHRVTGRHIDWCGGLGFLIILTVIIYLALLYFVIAKPWIKKSRVKIELPEWAQKLVKHRMTQVFTAAAVFIAIGIFLVIDTAEDRYRRVSSLLLNAPQEVLVFSEVNLIRELVASFENAVSAL